MKINSQKGPLAEIESLVTFRKAFNNPELSLWDFIHYRSDFDLAFAFCKLFFPDFIQVDGCVLLAELYDSKTFEDWKNNSSSNSRQELEAMINHVHIYDRFSESEDSAEVSREICEEIGKYIAKSWAVALKEAFPEKQFDIHFTSDPDDYGPTITFCQRS